MKLADAAFVAAVAAGLNVVASGVSGAFMFRSLPHLILPGLSISHNLVYAEYLAVIVVWGTSLCSFAFFLALSRYCEGSPSRISLRRAGMAAMVASLLGFLMSIILHLGLLEMGIKALVMTIPSLAVIGFFAIFVEVPEPLAAVPTRWLAGILAVVNGYWALMRISSIWRMTQSTYPPGMKFSWELLPHSAWLQAPLALENIFYGLSMATLMVFIALGAQRRSNAVERLQNIAR